MASGPNNNFLSNIDRKSWFHSLDPRLKIFLMLFFGAIPLIFTDPRVILFFIILCLPLWLTSNLKLRPMVPPLVGAGFMIFIVFLFNTIRLQGDTIDAGIQSTWTFGVGPILITSYSITKGLFLAGRLLVPVTIGLLIISTTDPTYLAKGIRKLGIPTPIVFMLLAALRFIPIVMEQLNNIQDALSIRGMSGSRIKRTQSIILPLFITSLRRTRTMGLASEAKAFGSGRWNSFYEEFYMGRNDKILLYTIILVSIVAIVLRFGLGFGAGFYIPGGAR